MTRPRPTTRQLERPAPGARRAMVPTQPAQGAPLNAGMPPVCARHRRRQMIDGCCAAWRIPGSPRMRALPSRRSTISGNSASVNPAGAGPQRARARGARTGPARPEFSLAPAVRCRPTAPGRPHRGRQPGPVARFPARTRCDVGHSSWPLRPAPRARPGCGHPRCPEGRPAPHRGSGRRRFRGHGSERLAIEQIGDQVLHVLLAVCLIGDQDRGVLKPSRSRSPKAARSASNRPPYSS